MYTLKILPPKTNIVSGPHFNKKIIKKNRKPKNKMVD